jgi:hypothetical protein
MDVCKNKYGIYKPHSNGVAVKQRNSKQPVYKQTLNGCTSCSIYWEELGIASRIQLNWRREGRVPTAYVRNRHCTFRNSSLL